MYFEIVNIYVYLKFSEIWKLIYLNGSIYCFIKTYYLTVFLVLLMLLALMNSFIQIIVGYFNEIQQFSNPVNPENAWGKKSILSNCIVS